MSIIDVCRRLGNSGVALPSCRLRWSISPRVFWVGDFIFPPGQGAVSTGGSMHQGRVIVDLCGEEARGYARLAGINFRAVLQRATGDLNRIARFVWLFGIVRAPPDFQDHPKLFDGCAELLAAIFGRDGQDTSGTGGGSRRITPATD